jgi:hypothetical protein
VEWERLLALAQNVKPQILKPHGRAHASSPIGQEPPIYADFFGGVVGPRSSSKAGQVLKDEDADLEDLPIEPLLSAHQIG